jgi:hypothetical protein
MTVPQPVRLFVGILCAVVLLSALGMIVAALFLSSKPVWVLFGFEFAISVASVLGILFARGKFQEGQGLAMACVAGTIAVGSFLGWLGTQHHLTTARGDIPLNTWLLGRLAAAAALGAVGAMLVLSRNPRSWSYLLKSAITGGPLLILLAAFFVKRSAFTGALGHLPDWIAGLAAILGGLVAVVLISASVHCLIRAFELGRE